MDLYCVFKRMLDESMSNESESHGYEFLSACVCKLFYVNPLKKCNLYLNANLRLTGEILRLKS